MREDHRRRGASAAVLAEVEVEVGVGVGAIVLYDGLETTLVLGTLLIGLQR